MVLALTLVVGLLVGVFLVGKSVLDRAAGPSQPMPAAQPPAPRPPKRTTPLALHEVKRIFVQGSYPAETDDPGPSGPVRGYPDTYWLAQDLERERIEGVRVVKSEAEADAVLSVHKESKDSWKEFRIDTPRGPYEIEHVRGNYQVTTATMKARLIDRDTGQEIWKTTKTESYVAGQGRSLFGLVIQQLQQDREKSRAQQ